MSSLLAKQLEQHRQSNPLPPPADAKKSRPSILFRDATDGVKANELDARQILDLGRNGLQKLCAINADLKKYQQTLFSTVLGSDPRSERHLLPKSERESVDEECKDLLLEISPHLNTEAGKQVLEFLLQRYMVHMSNVDALFSSILPYHDTPLFTAVTVLPSLAIANTRWQFLKKIKFDARGITRVKLVSVCSGDLALFDEICRTLYVNNSRLFGAVVLEVLEKLNKDDVGLKQLENYVQVATRNALDCLKIDSIDNIAAACAIFGSCTRLLSLSVEATESVCIVLARKLNHIRSKNKERLAECEPLLASCIIQVFEWQSRANAEKERLFENADRWGKFEKYCGEFTQLFAEMEANHSSALGTEFGLRAIDGLLDGMAGIVKILTKSGEQFDSRALLFANAIIRKSSVAMISNEDAARLRSAVEAIAMSQPDALSSALAALQPNDRVQLQTTLFPDPSSKLAIRFMPAEHDLNLPLAVSDARIQVRLSALRHLKSHPNKIDQVLFQNGDQDVSLILLENILSETKSRTPEMNEELASIMELFVLAEMDAQSSISSQVLHFARRALVDPLCVQETQIVEAVVRVLTRSDSEDDALLLAGLLHEKTSVTAKLKNLINERLSKSWLSGWSNDSKASAKALVKKLKKESAESVEQKMNKLARVAPQVACQICEELLDSFDHSAEWLLSILESLSTNATVKISSPTKVAKNIVSSLSFETFLQRALECAMSAWIHVLPLVVETIRMEGVDATRQVLENCIVIKATDDVKDDRRIVRALRLLNTMFSLNDAKSPQKEWVALLACLKHTRSRSIRSEALNVLQHFNGRLKDLLVPRRNEIERDASAVDRSLRGDVQMRTIFAKQASSAVDQADYAVARAIVESCGDSALAASVLSRVFERTQSPSEDERGLVNLAFSFLALSENPKKDELATLALICTKGLIRFPCETLSWIVASPKRIAVLPATKDVLSSLVDIATGSSGAFAGDAETDPSLVTNTVEKSGLVLTSVAFPEGLILDKLRSTIEDVIHKPSKGKNGAEGIDATAIRKLCVLVDAAGSNASPRSWATTNALFDVAKIASDISLSLLEQTVLAALERITIAVGEDEQENQLEALCEKLLKIALKASHPSAKMAAIRAFAQARPSDASFERAFKEIDDILSLERLADAICSRAAPRSIAQDSTLVSGFCEAVHRFQPHNRVALLRAFAGRCENPADVVSHWMRLSSSETDCSAIAGQFDAQVQTDLLVQLVEEGERSGLQFVAKHLSSRTYMKALVEKDDTDISGFIQLFEGLLRKLLDLEQIKHDPEAGDEETRLASALMTVVEKAIDALSVLLAVPIFIPVVTETLMREESRLRMLALRVIKTKVTDEHAEWSKSEIKVVLEFVETLVSWLDDPSSATHTTALALNAIAQYLAADHKLVFAKAVTHVAPLLDSEDATLASATCLFLGTVAKKVTTHFLSHVPSVVPALVRCAQSNQDEVLRQAAFAALKDIIESNIALGSLLDQVTDLALTASDADDLLDAIGQYVEPRVGFATCLKALRDETNVLRAMKLLQKFLSRTTSADAIVHLKELKEISVESLARVKDFSAYDASAIISIGLLLSEKRLRELVDDLKTAVDEERVIPAVFIDVMRMFLEKCGSLFLPIVPFEFLLDTLKGDLISVNESKKQKEKSKRAKASTVPRIVSLEVSMRCLGECLIHAMNSGFVDVDKFEQVLQVLVSALECCPFDFCVQFVEPCFATLTLSCLSSSQANGMLQSSHHSVTRLLRSQTARVRQAALSCIKTLFERVGNDYLMLLPDTLPFLAELLEDQDEDIRILAQKLALVLKDVSGEDISEFLK